MLYPCRGSNQNRPLTHPDETVVRPGRDGWAFPPSPAALTTRQPSEEDRRNPRSANSAIAGLPSSWVGITLRWVGSLRQRAHCHLTNSLLFQFPPYSWSSVHWESVRAVVRKYLTHVNEQILESQKELAKTINDAPIAPVFLTDQANIPLRVYLSTVSLMIAALGSIIGA